MQRRPSVTFREAPPDLVTAVTPTAMAPTVAADPARMSMDAMVAAARHVVVEVIALVAEIGPTASG